MNSRAVLALFATVMVTMAVVASGHSALAVSTRTWTGLGATNNWSDAANWDSGAPVAGDSLVFPESAGRKTNTNDLVPNTLFDTITFEGQGYALAGNPLGLTNELRNRPGSGANKVSLAFGGAGEVVQESGRLTLEGANSYAGATSVTGGVLAARSDAALGDDTSGTTVSPFATLQLSNGIDIGAERLVVAGEGFDKNGALQSVSGTNYAGDVRVLGDTVIGVGNSTLVVGVLRQEAPGSTFTLVGGGKLQVEGSFYAGSGTVEEGNLTWNATSQLFVEVGKHGLLRGTGKLSSATVVGGAIWPGWGNTPGTLTVAGPTVLNGLFRVDLDGPLPGSGYGQLATEGISIGAVTTFLEVHLDYQPALGQVFRIVDNAGVEPSGEFYNLPEGAILFANGYALRVSYKGGDGNDITLTVVRQIAANLELTLAGQPSPVAAGDLLIYTASVTNLGPDDSEGARVSMGTPAGTTFVSVSAPAAWRCSLPSPSVSLGCTGATLASGASAVFTITYRVDPGASGQISGTAGVSAHTNDPFSANNAETVITPIGQGGGKPYRLFVGGLAADGTTPEPGPENPG